jgi:hypothetical protein
MDRTETKDKSKRLIKPHQEEAPYTSILMQRNVMLRLRKPIPLVKSAVPKLIFSKSLLLRSNIYEPCPKMEIFF